MTCEAAELLIVSGLWEMVWLQFTPKEVVDGDRLAGSWFCLKAITQVAEPDGRSLEVRAVQACRECRVSVSVG